MRVDREKVIGHLGILRTWCAVNPAFGRGLDVEDCDKAVGWLDDAIGMMQADGERETTSSVSAGGAATFPKGEGSGEAQEPRLVTYEDFHSGREDGGEAIPCWKEARNKTRRSGWAVIVYGKMLTDRETGVARYWTARPSDEQMEATPWN